MVWGRERTIPTERPPLVGKVIASFLNIKPYIYNLYPSPESDKTLSMKCGRMTEEDTA
jgi:hypothetical protein